MSSAFYLAVGLGATVMLTVAGFAAVQGLRLINQSSSQNLQGKTNKVGER